MASISSDVVSRRTFSYVTTQSIQPFSHWLTIDQSSQYTYTLQLALATQRQVQRVFVEVPIRCRNVQLDDGCVGILWAMDRATVRDARSTQPCLIHKQIISTTDRASRLLFEGRT